jgi:2-aminoadipate transaminase
MPEGVHWTTPAGGFLTWLTLPPHLDAVELRPQATASGVAYVPGPPFHVGDQGGNTLRLSFSHLDEDDLREAARRLGGVLDQALVGAR